MRDAETMLMLPHECLTGSHSQCSQIQPCMARKVVHRAGMQSRVAGVHGLSCTALFHLRIGAGLSVLGHVEMRPLGESVQLDGVVALLPSVSEEDRRPRRCF